jgi:23S rRNA (cytidine2498-2'-O)-methyltransferase
LNDPLPFDHVGYLAAEGFTEDLLAELGGADLVLDRLVFKRGGPRHAAWAANVWLDPVLLEAPSIGAGAKALRGLQRNWALHAPHLQGRARLIQERLPVVSAKPMAFGMPAPAAPLGSWTLLDEATIVAARTCSSPWPNGAPIFVEDRSGPPSRAYLKLWEAFTRLGVQPAPGDVCLDLGSAPGGWSWVLAGLGARTLSVDKAPLAPEVAAMPGLTHVRQSAFALEPGEIGPVDWLFSDVICYPARLLALVRRWLDAGSVRNFLCTVKFQGPTDHVTAQAFAAIPGSRLFHLHHNKHELTWVRLAS